MMTDNERVLLMKALDEAGKSAELLCQLENLQAELAAKELNLREGRDVKPLRRLVEELGQKILENTTELNKLVARIYQGMAMEPFLGFSSGLGASRALLDARLFWLANPGLNLHKQGDQ